MAAGNPVEFWFEFASSYSYPAAMRIEQACRAQGVPLTWRPFLLGPIFRALGWSTSPFILQPAKGRYMWRDLERTCARLGIAFRKPSQMPRNGLTAARIACAADGADWLPEFVRRVYGANFAHDLDIAQSKVLLECLDGLVPDPQAQLAMAAAEDAKSKLRRNTEEAIELGIFGAPSFVVNGELFWGNDRLEEALAWSRTGAG